MEGEATSFVTKTANDQDSKRYESSIISNSPSHGTDRARTVLLSINVLFGIVGSLVTALAISIIADWRFWTIASETKIIKNMVTPEIRAVMILVLFGGLLTIFLSIFGIVGMLSNRARSLRIYSIILGILALGDLIAFVLVLIYRNDLENIYQTGMSKSLNEALLNNDQQTLDAFNKLQQRLGCCGANGPQDYNKTRGPILHRSCFENEHIMNTLYSNGCIQTLLNFFRPRVSLVAVGIIAFAIVEFAGMISSLVVLRNIQ